ncbi:CGH_1_collapsed_G0057050.mRNA.1.CDS.1 [Saccharomyces cerevisiae]|nr:CGH_1_collapsed_G0057050.mRNA.1.CDS.1 [Saccharomyces cerevisiae]
MVDVEEKSQEVEYVDPTVNRVPNYEVSEKAFLLTQSKVSIEQRKEAAEFVLAKIKEEEMAPYYKYLCEEYLVNNGQSDLEHDEKSYTMNCAKKNESKIKELNEKIQKLEEDDEGELEQAQAWINLGEYYAQIGDKDNAEKTLGKSLSKAISTGAKIDVMLTIARLGFFYNDQLYVKEKLEALLVDSLATFTSIELTSYESIATYASVTGLFTLERTDLKSKVIDSPELLSLISTTAALQSISSLTISFYASDYASYFPYLLETYANVLIPCKYLNRHADFFVREMRRKVYAQLLESYKTLSLKSMASAFGVSVAFLDNDLGKFIPNKQLNCVIDRVNGIVETNRPDNKNAQYHLLVKQGDGLLTKLQKIRCSSEIDRV